jgi:hypothetical protein
LLAQIAIFVKAEASARSAQTGRGDPISGVTIRRRRKAAAWRRRRTTGLCNSLKIFAYVSFIDGGGNRTPEGRIRLADFLDAPRRRFSLLLS